MKLRKTLTTFLILLATLLSMSTSLFAIAPVPSGYSLVYPNNLTQTYKGVRVYTKVSGSTKDFVTVVDLRYATLRNFVGSYGSGQTGSTLLNTKTLNTFWSDAVAQNTILRRATAAFNGTFFTEKPSGQPSPIAFGVRQDGWLISYGYGLNEYPNLIKTFAFDSSYGSSSIQKYSADSFKGPTPNVIGGLDPSANKDGAMNSSIARTFVGVRDDNNDTRSETIIFFSSNAATQARAVSVLQTFGAGDKMMLDGGGSTGFILNGDSKISTPRPIPQAFIVYEGR